MLYKEVPFDPKGVAPVSLMVLAANVICINPQLPAKNLSGGQQKLLMNG